MKITYLLGDGGIKMVELGRQYNKVLETGFAAVMCTKDAARYFEKNYGKFREHNTISPVMASIRTDPFMKYSIEERRFYVTMRDAEELFHDEDARAVFEQHHFKLGRKKAYSILGKIASAVSEDPYFNVDEKTGKISLSPSYYIRKDMPFKATFGSQEGIDNVVDETLTATPEFARLLEELKIGKRRMV